jgi:hypothetical protein
MPDTIGELARDLAVFGGPEAAGSRVLLLDYAGNRRQPRMGGDAQR